ncbi:MAG: SGNH/GDSL hydrolase family protein [Bacteroidota bacterium]|nr:SGNH/GDSL hydrolase family protein [Bacteroidota bacterium]MDP3146314.1 SGNH/GDSL hydrolase family protein [Bacteroidota bacterium]
MQKNFIYLFLMTLMFSNFKEKKPQTINYLPLGDSYTICTGATESDSWPVLLTKHLNENKINCKLLDNPARNGFSTQDLIDNELPLLKKLKPNFVTLLIGVNDWVRGVTKENFTKNLIYILDEVQKNIPDKKKVILITIPDFGVTPQGKNYGNGRDIQKGLAEFNAVISNEAKKRELPLVDIFGLSQKMKDDATLVAIDGLHPSAKEYALWEKLILKETLIILK